MQTFDILIASGPSFNSVCFSSAPLPPFSSLPLWGGITQENRKGGSSPICPPCQVKPEGAGRVEGVSLLPSWLFAESRWWGQGCQTGAGLSDLCSPGPGVADAVDKGWGPPGGKHTSRESQGLEAGMRPNSGPSCATYLPCGHKQVTRPLWASVSTSVQTEEVLCPAYLTGLL